jgi:oxygen-independent coproporphyrinogen-3 oxidase
MNQDDRIRGEVILSLMCRFAVNLDAIAPREYFAESLRKLQPLADDGLVEVREGHVRATPLGRMFIRNVAMCFDAHLAKTEHQPAPVFSRTV